MSSDGNSDLELDMMDADLEDNTLVIKKNPDHPQVPQIIKEDTDHTQVSRITRKDVTQTEDSNDRLLR